MSTIEGVVEKVNTTYSGPESPRKWIKKSVLVNEVWYGGFVNKDNEAVLSQVKEGDAVKVEYETKGKYINLVGLTILSKAAAAASPAVAASASTVLDKDLRITYNGSLKSAVAFVEAAAKLDLLALPAKKDAKLDAFYEYVKYYTDVFVADTYAAKLVPQETNNNNETAYEAAE